MNFKYIKSLDNKLLNGLIYKTYKKYYLDFKIKKAQTNTIVNINKLDKYKFLTFWNMHFNHIIKNSLRGDIVECGVGNGFHLSFILFNMITKNELGKKKYYGFDSFEGFPTPSEEDISPRNPKKGDWDHTNEDYVKYNLKKVGFDENDFIKIQFIKGYFNESFLNNQDLIKEISLLHLDCDLYKSYKESLEFMYPKVVQNGIIVFDEYLDQKNFPGAIKAIDDFFGQKIQDIQKCDITGKYYLIKK